MAPWQGPRPDPNTHPILTKTPPPGRPGLGRVCFLLFFVVVAPPKPYKFIGFGDLHVPKPYKFTGFGDLHVPGPYKFIGFGDLPGPKPPCFSFFVSLSNILTVALFGN